MYLVRFAGRIATRRCVPANFFASLAHPRRARAALRSGCAAAHLRRQQNLRFLPVKQGDDVLNVPVMLQTIVIQSPIRSLIPGASLRDRATLPSPLLGLGPSGG